MKNKLAIAVILSATGLASVAMAATYTYTFNDMTWVPDNAKDTFNRARYYEYRGPDRWGTVWEKPYSFTTTYPSSETHTHFHIGFMGNSDCLDFSSGGMGYFENGVCVALDPLVDRGPFSTHTHSHALYFQLIDQSGGVVPFVVKNIDVYTSQDDAITLYVRKETDGGWFYWPELHGYLDGTPSHFRWILNSGYTGKFTAMAWKTVSGEAHPSSVGRVQITD